MTSAEPDRTAMPPEVTPPEVTPPEAPSSEASSSRRDLLRAGGTAFIASLLGVFGVATAGSAKNNDAVRAGEKTTATRATLLESSKGPALQAKLVGRSEGVGVKGSTSSPKGIGVQGEATAEKGASVGVQGLSGSPGGVAGQFTASRGGTAVEATASDKQGVALRTKGRLELRERSGISSVSGGAEFVIPVAGGLSDKSIIIATLQDHHPGVHVESASVLDVEEGLIVVRLSQAVPEPAKVGWIVLD
jgi:hypothetical protein